MNPELFIRSYNFAKSRLASREIAQLFLHLQLPSEADLGYSFESYLQSSLITVYQMGMPYLDDCDIGRNNLEFIFSSFGLEDPDDASEKIDLSGLRLCAGWVFNEPEDERRNADKAILDHHRALTAFWSLMIWLDRLGYKIHQ